MVKTKSLSWVWSSNSNIQVLLPKSWYKETFTKNKDRLLEDEVFSSKVV